MRKINPESYKIPYIGKYALKQQLKIKLQEYEEKTVQKNEIVSTKKKYDEIYSSLNNCNFEITKTVLSAPTDLKKTNDEIDKLKIKLHEAENDINYIQLQIEAEELKNEINSIQSIATQQIIAHNHTNETTLCSPLNELLKILLK